MASYNGFAAAVKDLRLGVELAPLWWRVGLDQTAARYRRTLLGPFWIAGSTLATGLALALVFGGLLGADWRKTFPFILTGVMAWVAISTAVVDGSQTFMQASGQMQVKRLPLSFYVFLQMDRVLINFAHQIVAYWVLFIPLGLFEWPHWQLPLALALVLSVGFFLSFPLGMLATRYRDFAYFVSIAMSAMFMLTPVFWRRTQVSNNFIWIVDYNPFTYLLEIMRQPFLGEPATLHYWLVSLGILVASIVAAIVSLTLFRRRVVFWL